MSELPDKVSEASEVTPPPTRGFDRCPDKAGDQPKTRVSRKSHFNTSHSKSSLSLPQNEATPQNVPLGARVLTTRLVIFISFSWLGWGTQKVG